MDEQGGLALDMPCAIALRRASDLAGARLIIIGGKAVSARRLARIARALEHRARAAAVRSAA